jgi:hypothetical protein
MRLWTALRTCIGDVVTSAILELLDQPIIDIERLFRVIVEEMDSTWKSATGLVSVGPTGYAQPIIERFHGGFTSSDSSQVRSLLLSTLRHVLSPLQIHAAD